jgi:hypothetical protein
MASKSETGHAKNVANLEDLISFCQGYGPAYNPAKENLKIPQLTTLYEEANTVLNELKLGKTNFDIATNDRRNAFKDIKPLSTKIVNAFSVLVGSDLAIDDARGINRKIQGTTTRKKTATADAAKAVKDVKNAKASETSETSENSESSKSEMTPKFISTSQQSYDRFIDHFGSLMQLLEQYPTYIPNESALSTAQLSTKLNLLKSTNTALINTYTTYSNAMMRRNKLLYDTETGLIKTTKDIKLYVKSIFGPKSPEFKQINKLVFSTLTS